MFCSAWPQPKPWPGEAGGWGDFEKCMLPCYVYSALRYFFPNVPGFHGTLARCHFSMVSVVGSHWSNKCTLLMPGLHQVLQYKCTEEAGFLLTVQMGQAKCVPQSSM